MNSADFVRFASAFASVMMKLDITGENPLVNPICKSVLFVNFTFSSKQYSNSFFFSITAFIVTPLQLFTRQGSLYSFITRVNILVLNDVGIGIVSRILLNTGVIYSGILSLPYFKCSAHNQYFFWRFFSVFNSSTTDNL